MILSEGIKRGSDLFEVYLLHLLDAIVSKGDAHENDSKPFGDIELAAREIAQLLRPLATFAALTASPNVEEDLGIEGFANLQRDAWFNAVVHGFSLTSPYGVQYRQELQTLAKYTMPLIAEDRAYQLESDIELNTTLRRGKSPEQASEYRKHLVQALPKCESEIKSLNYSELVFLTSAYLVENLRAMSGDCTRVLTYFLDPRLRSGDLGTCMVQVSESTIRTYVSRTKSGKGHEFSSPHVAQQLALFFSACCHRISKVQNVAIGCADWIISQVPSALCHKSSLYALFELLSIMWISCLEQDTEEYEWRSKFTSEKGKVEVELSDDYSFRWETLVNLHKWAKSWVKRVLDISPLDIKGLIQTYLSDYSDEGSYDHISLGRSFALEMGGLIPSTDQRLGAVPHHPDMPINTASDFIVQYTTRQEYRYIDGLQDINSTMIKGVSLTDQDTTKIEKSLNDTRTILEDIENRASQQQTVSVAEIRDVLRRAGALLCRTHSDEGAIIHHLVGIPFAVLSKQAIKLGISLWTGVIKENPCTESRILAEVAECWENTVRKRRGLFDRRLGYVKIWTIIHFHSLIIIGNWIHSL
jgi:phosphatidylinositol 4-kinase